MRLLIVSLILNAIFTSGAASAETARCPLSDANDCDRWEVERADEELTALLSQPSEWIDRMPERLRANARAALQEAQANWIKFRDAECRRELTLSYMTAMTERGYLANCALNMIFHRRNELMKQYTFRSP